MIKQQELEKLDARNKELAQLIESAEREENPNRYALKKEMYANKIKMIEIITIEEKRAGITFRELKRLVELRPKVPRYETGIEPLDRKLMGGFEIGTFVQLAGESGVGKTKVIQEIATNVAHQAKVVFFNFEMGDKRITDRFEKTLTTDAQMDNLIIDSHTRNIDALCNEITLYAREGVKFFMIDSKMKIEVSERLKEHEKYALITSRLAKVTQENDIIVVLINQMSNEDIKAKRLEFKGSGDQKYDSDISLFYVRDEAGKRTMICNKNRQDEVEFKIDLFLQDGKLVGTDAQFVYQNKDGRYTGKPNVTEYKTAEMPTL